MSFNHTFRYIDDVLSINNHNFHNFVHLVYPDELEIKNTTESDKSASYLDILLYIDSNGRLTTTLNDIRDDFDFAIAKFPFPCSNVTLHLLMVCISSIWFDTQKTCFVWGLFKMRQTTDKKVDAAGFSFKVIISQILRSL
jgi:hypothetical protein